MAEIDSTSDKPETLPVVGAANPQRTGHCDARFHFIKLFSALPASTQVISIEKGLYILHTALSPESGLTAGHFS
ncbi:BnaC03g60610D [Brassica napus]|uniref:BnaC03g60610D protein n=1 Tax=Brassica napus TaxID=3708 RepID=A0A078JJ43_BRANA|nr:BnaC03g60610D [Brassica napus]